MTEAKTKLGKRPCPVCGESVHVRANAAGTISITCSECDFSGFAKKGTDAARRLTPASSAPAAPGAPTPPPTPPRKAGGFDLAGLAR